MTREKVIQLPTPAEVKRYEVRRYEEPIRPDDRRQIWKALEATVSRTIVTPYDAFVDRAYQYVDLNPGHDTVEWSVINGYVFGQEETAVVMDYYGKEEGRIRHFPVGNRELYLNYLLWIAGQPSFSSRELRVVWPASQFSLAEIRGIFGPDWDLKQYQPDEGVEKHNPQMVTRMGLISEGRNEIEPPQLPAGFSFRGLVPEDREAQYELLDKYYILNSFREESLVKGTHMVVTGQDGKIVASAGIIAQANQQVYILGDMVTDPSQRGKGIATAIIYKLIDSVEQKHRAFSLPVPVFVADAINETSRKNFKRLGFTQAETTFWSVHENTSLF